MQGHGKKVAINSIAGIIYKIVILLMGFISRKLFIVYMGRDLLGLNSLFTDLLSFLNLADLGIGVSVQFSLYKPIAENDEQKILSIVCMAKKVFDAIGIIITLVGFGLTFFLNYFIAENPYTDSFLRIVFFMNVLSISLTYFVAHKKIFLQAKEEIYIINIIDTLTQVIGTVLKILIIVVLKNYYFYVAVSIVSVIISNICIEIICDKRYNFLNEKIKVKKSDKKGLINGLKDVIPLKIGTYLYSSTDNVVISTFLGLKDVAIYSNYLLITNAVMQFFYMIAEAFKVSVGNIFYEEQDKDRIIDYFNGYLLLQFLLSSFSVVSLWCLITPFVVMFFGKEYEMASSIVAVLLFDMFVHSMYQPLSMMFGALGKFKEDKNITLGIDVVNIIVSVILVKKIGLLGPVVGTLISNILTWYFRCYQIVYKAFAMDVKKFVGKIACYFLLAVFEVIISFYLCRTFFDTNTIYNFVGRILICLIVPNTVNCLCWYKTKDFQMLFSKFKGMLP